MRSQNAFTLIELLVVIGIIAIIAGMLMPALSLAREKGVTTDCLNNQKQLAMGITMYGNDFKEWFPPIRDNVQGANVEGYWIYYTGFPVPTKGNFYPEKGLLYEYVKAKKSFLCRGDSTGSNLSYAINSNCRDNKISAADNPAETLLFLEEGYRSGSKTTRTTDDGYFQVAGNTVVNRHQKGSVYSFFDGHVQWDQQSISWARANCLLER